MIMSSDFIVCKFLNDNFKQELKEELKTPLRGAIFRRFWDPRPAHGFFRSGCLENGQKPSPLMKKDVLGGGKADFHTNKAILRLKMA